MAWICTRCNQKIYAPRREAVRFALEWTYAKSRRNLSVDLKNLGKIKDKSTITHLSCTEEVPGFKGRMREALKIPKGVDHPLLD